MAELEQAERRARRERTQALFTALSVQVEVMTALLEAGALTPEAVRPIAARIRDVAGSWTPYFPDGADMLLVPLGKLEGLVARRLKDGGGL